MTITDATRDFVSIGSLACTLQVSVRSIERSALQLGIEPALRINGIPHFDGVQAERLTTHLRHREPGGCLAIAPHEPASAAGKSPPRRGRSKPRGG